MRLDNLPIDNSVGTVLVHNLVGQDGRKALSKGHLLRTEDLDKLRALGLASVYVAVLEHGDVREDDAATQLARAVAEEGIERSKPSGGRVNFYATQPGFFKINTQALEQVNALPGVTLATIHNYALASPKKMLATLKTIGLGLPRATLEQAERMTHENGPVLRIAPVRNARVAVILTASANGRARTHEVFAPPIRARIEEAGAQVISEVDALEQEDEIASAIAAALGAGAQMIILAGETSIMDADDITPRAMRRAGGTVELYGAPVEPGNLLLLAYCDAVPIIGAPGCIKSRETNAVDLILPRLLLGERVTRADVNAFADGGLLPGA